MASEEVVHFACSSGGHIDLLARVADASADFRRIWVTQPSELARSLVADGEDVRLLPAYDRNVLSQHMAVNLSRSVRLVAKQRPRLVITSGSGLIVPFCVMARAAGARVAFVETTARVRSPSASGRVLSRLAASVLVQWPSMQAVYPGSRVCRPPVLDAVSPGISTRGGGTFVSVGTHVQPFDRLLRTVERAAGRGVLPLPLTVQTGPSSIDLAGVEARTIFPPAELTAHIDAASVVVCHAGTGSITAALKAGRRPLVLARRQRDGEHFDDHQHELAGELERLGLVVLLDEEITEEEVAAARRPLESPVAGDLPTVKEALAEEIARLTS